MSSTVGEGSVVRFSLFELEDQLRLERSRQLRMINTTLVGAMVGVSWSYIVEQLADPWDECPAEGCWGLIALLSVSLVGGVFLIPLVQVLLQKTLGDFLSELEALDTRRERLSGTAEASLFGAAAVLAVERHSIFSPRSASHFGFRRAVVGKLLLLLTNAGDSAFVVTSANVLYYVTKQFEYEESGGRAFVRDQLRGRGADVEGGGHFALVAGTCAAVCVGAAATATAVAIFSAKRLAIETDAYRVRLWLLLSTHPHYPAAYAVSIAVSVVVFSPLELRTGSPELRAILASVQLILFGVGGRLLSRKFAPPPPSDPETRLARAAESPRSCARFLAHDGCAVLAAIGVQNSLDFITRGFDVATFLCVYAVYTPSLLVNAHFRHRRRMQKIRNKQQLDTDEKHNPRDIVARLFCSVTDAAFEDTCELWLITLGFWRPYTVVLYILWDYVIIKTDDALTTLMLRILQQIAIAGILTFFIAFVAGALVVYRELYARLFLHKRVTSAIDNDDPPSPQTQNHFFTRQDPIVNFLNRASFAASAGGGDDEPGLSQQGRAAAVSLGGGEDDEMRRRHGDATTWSQRSRAVV